MQKRFLFFLSAGCLAAISTYFFFPKDTKEKHCIHDEDAYIQFCNRIVLEPRFYNSFRSHPLYGIFQEDLNEETAKKCFAILEKEYPHLLHEEALIAALDSVGSPWKLFQENKRPISYPTLRNLKIEGDLERHFGSLAGKTIVQIGAGDGTLCKIVHTLQKPGRHIIVDIPSALAVAKKTLIDWGVHDVELVSIEDFIAPAQIDLVISSFVFSESRFNVQDEYLSRIIRHAKQGYFDCRFPMRHFGLKPRTQQQLVNQLCRVGKKPQVVQEEPLTDIDRCLILFDL